MAWLLQFLTIGPKFGRSVHDHPMKRCRSVSHFEKNLEILRRKNPSLAHEVERVAGFQKVQVIDTRSGEKVPALDGRTLHSTYNPAEEARRLASVQPLKSDGIIVILGLGFAYHVEALLDLTALPVIVVEHRIDLLRAAMEHRDLERMLARVTILCGRPPGALLALDEAAGAVAAGSWTLIPHDPSVRLNPVYYETVRMQLLHGRGRSARSPLKVMVVTPLYGGSYPIARYAAKGLEQSGCETWLLDLAPFRDASRCIDSSLKNTSVQPRVAGLFEGVLLEYVYWKTKELHPDLVFFLAQAPVSAELLKKLRGENFRTAFWFVENYRVFPYWKEIAPHCDAFFAIQRGDFFDRLDEAGAFDHHYLPLACDPDVHSPRKLGSTDRTRYGSEVSLAGFGYYNRLHMLQGLTDFAPKLWGPGWDRASSLVPFIQDKGSEFDVETMVKIYNASAINLNIHSSTSSTDVEPCADFVNPRTFELAGCGAFQLTDERTELSGLFSVESEIATFRDLPALRGRIKHFLAHREERAAMAQSARARALAEHTYAIRMRQMLECLYPASWIERWSTAADTAGRLLARIPEDHDLGPILSGLPSDSKVKIEDLIAAVQNKSPRAGGQEVTLRWMDGILRAGRRR
jgi:spore maturation protein CgeB